MAANGAFVGDYTGLTSSGNKFLAIFVQAGTDGVLNRVQLIYEEGLRRLRAKEDLRMAALI